MKKIFMAILTAVFLVPTLAWGSNGTTTGGLYWDLTDGVLTISGSGASGDYTTLSRAGWYSERANITSVVVEEGVTTIGTSLFYNLGSCTTIKLPSSLTNINSQPFYNCSTLVSITCLATNVPICKTNYKGESDSFKGVPTSCTIYVPSDKQAEYEAAIGWNSHSKFAAISGSVTPPASTPTLTVSTSSLDFGSFFQGQAESKTFTVSGENLTGDVALSLSNMTAQNCLTLDQTTITLDELAEGPVTVTVSVNPAREYDFLGAQITIASEGAESKTISAKGTVKVQVNENVSMFSVLHTQAGSGWDTKKFTYTGTSAKIASYDEYNHTITLRDASNKTVIVEIPDANWENMPLVIGLKVVDFTFTATYQSGILEGRVFATPITLLFDDVFNYSDETTASELIEEDGQSASVAVTRSLIFSSYNTICLPFSMSVQEVGDVFGSTTSILSLTSSSLSENEITLDFAVCDHIDAGVPYLIKPAATVEGWLKSSTSITATPVATETAVVHFIGVLTPTVVEASGGNLFLGAGNTLYYNQAQGTLKGMRAYFQVVEPSAVGAPARIRTANETATGIESTFDAERAQKLLNEGRVIIRIDGHDYDLNGTMIR